jgi:hypothetical protein
MTSLMMRDLVRYISIFFLSSECTSIKVNVRISSARNRISNVPNPLLAYNKFPLCYEITIMFILLHVHSLRGSELGEAPEGAEVDVPALVAAGVAVHAVGFAGLGHERVLGAGAVSKARLTLGPGREIVWRGLWRGYGLQRNVII